MRAGVSQGCVPCVAVAESVRLITDRSEWDSLSRLSGSIYHHYDWTAHTARRLEGFGPVTFGYLRMWDGDSLIGCPVVKFCDRWFNTPRAVPAILSGGEADAIAVVSAAHSKLLKMRGVNVDPDVGLLYEIAARRRRVERGEPVRVFKSMLPSEIKQMVGASSSPEPVQDVWVQAVVWLWRAAWETSVVSWNGGWTIHAGGEC